MCIGFIRPGIKKDRANLVDPARSSLTIADYHHQGKKIYQVEKAVFSDDAANQQEILWIGDCLGLFI